jgi:hypothetical protein
LPGLLVILPGDIAFRVHRTRSTSGPGALYVARAEGDCRADPTNKVTVREYKFLNPMVAAAVRLGSPDLQVLRPSRRRLPPGVDSCRPPPGPAAPLHEILDTQ